MEFDLHSHTTISDGKTEPEAIKDIVGRNTLWSITDHNSIEYHKKFKAPITGTELSADIMVDGKKQAVEILVYGFDVNSEIIKTVDYVLSYANTIQQRNFLKLVDRVVSMGCTLTPNLSFGDGLFSHQVVFADLVKYPENQNILGNLLESPESFYHNGQTEGSPIYLDFNNCPYSLKEVCNIFRRNHGIILLAHPYYYKSVNTKNLLKSVLKDLNGIECLHPSANENNSIELIKFCKENHLLASGGSDFHKGEYLGTPNFHLTQQYPESFEWIQKINPQ